MAVQLIYKLHIITLLDSICFGLTYPFLSTYIQSLGADHVVVGVLSIGYLICNLISDDLVYLTKVNQRQSGMVIILFITMLTHFSLIVTSSYWFIIFGRCVYSIVANQSQNMCKDLLHRHAEPSMKDDHLTIFSILSGSGYIIGPMFAGYLFEIGFLYIGLLAVLLTLINICLATTISLSDNTSKENSNERTVLDKLYRNVNSIVSDCRNCQYKKNWDMMAIKFLHVSCIMIFYGKFSQILKHNYQSSPVIVGNTYAYMNSLTFLGTYFAVIAKDWYASFSPVTLAENSFRYLGLCLLVACYSPIYLMYMKMCIPIVLLSTFIDSIWRDLFATRKEESLARLDNPLKTAAGLITPVAFGVLCNTIGHHAVIIFSVIPAIASMYIITLYTKNPDSSSEADKKNE
ncbi:uncharacterized protein LOC108906358 [Anoplophora glabripennis]|uniref:uncharacterized protein LOC108906358 n=1 Tax=Anoplophora glabripennis TaxID=217634 RepID=UPI00087421D6|nr:uncharacterized protein LOC108906358 [Anoplophora glabripennis]